MSEYFLCRKRHVITVKNYVASDTHWRRLTTVVVHKLLTAFRLLPDALDECYCEPKHDELSHSFRIGNNRAHGQDCKEDYLS